MALWKSLDRYVETPPGGTVDLRGTTTYRSVEERKDLLFGGGAGPWPSALFGGAIGSYTGRWNPATGTAGRAMTFQRAIREGYARIPWVYAAVRVVALSQAGLRFGVKDSWKEVGDGATEILDDPLIELLNGQANPLEDASIFRQRVSTIWMLSPRGGFVELVAPARGSRNRVVALRIAPTSRTRIVPDSSGNIDHFEIDPLGGYGKPRPVPVERMRWFREPHPDDPFAGFTPLEAANLSIESDHFARLYNRQALANDGRPGGIVAVSNPQGSNEPADPDEMDRIERKFGGGPADAGRLVVLDGTVSYVDAWKSPRDMQWSQGLETAKKEVFGVFNVPVSAIDSSDRTFSNAGQEWINYWILRGQPHGDAFAKLWVGVVSAVPFLDYRKVAALEELRATRRAELRDEVQGGLRTPLSYAQETGQTVGDADGNFPNVPATRSLWRSGVGDVVVAGNDDDQQAVAKLAPLAGAAPPPADGDDSGDGGDDDGDDSGGSGYYTGGDPNDPSSYTNAGLRPGESKTTHLAKLARRRAREGAAGNRRVWHGDDDEESHRETAASAALTHQLSALAHRLVGTARARLAQPETKDLAGAQAPVDPGEWYAQAQQLAQQQLAPLAGEQAQATNEQIGAADLAGLAGVALPPLAATLLAGEVGNAVGWFAQSAANHAQDLIGAIAGAQATAPDDPSAATSAVDAWTARIPGWASTIAPTSVAQMIEGAKHAVLTPLGDRVERSWVTRHDDKVRSMHREADGQTQTAGVPFDVGGEQLRYPRDPLGSPGNTINCRCRTRWRLAKATTDPIAALGLKAFPVPRHADAARGHRGAERRVEFPAAPPTGPWLLHDLLGVPHEGKVRHVRTAAGEHEYHEPIGAPIVPHPGAPVPEDGAHDSGHASDVANAHAELAANGQTINDLIAKGMSPADAEKEYGRLFHNARFRYRRARIKAEKAGQTPPVGPADKAPDAPEPVEAAGGHVEAVAAAAAALPANRWQIGTQTIEHPSVKATRKQVEQLEAVQAQADAGDADAVRRHIEDEYRSSWGYLPGKEDGVDIDAEVAEFPKRLEQARADAEAMRQQFPDGTTRLDADVLGDPGQQTQAHLAAVLSAGSALAAEIDKRIGDRDFDGELAQARERHAEAQQTERNAEDALTEATTEMHQAVADKHGVSLDAVRKHAVRVRGYERLGSDPDAILDAHRDAGELVRLPDGRVAMRRQPGVAFHFNELGHIGMDADYYDEGDAHVMDGDEANAWVDAMQAKRRAVAADIKAGVESTPMKATKEWADQSHAEVIEAAREVQAAKDAKAIALRDTTLEVLREVRPVGPAGNATLKVKQKSGKAVEAIRTAEGYYPRDWLAAGSRVTLHGKTVQRGYYRDAGIGATVALSGVGGLHDTPPMTRCAVHELGHHMEQHVPGLTAMEWAFLSSRTKGENPKQLSKLAPGHGYGSKEVAMPDDFGEPYTGKVYGQPSLNTPRFGSLEVFTTYAESLLAGSNYLTRRDGSPDPQGRAFILGVFGVL